MSFFGDHQYHEWRQCFIFLNGAVSKLLQSIQIRTKRYLLDISAIGFHRQTRASVFRIWLIQRLFLIYVLMLCVVDHVHCISVDGSLPPRTSILGGLLSSVNLFALEPDRHRRRVD